MDNLPEIWKPVVGYEGLYSVSSLGRVRSEFAKYKGRIRRQQRSPSGYLVVGLSGSGKWKCARVHQLVAAAFIGPCPDGCAVNHNDGNKENNHADNLEYVTPSENQQHAKKLGLRTVRVGERNPMAKLTPEDIRKIKALRHATLGELAKRFKVSKQTICDIRAGRTWPHIT